VATVDATLIPSLTASAGAVQVVSVDSASLRNGPAVKVVWRVNSTPDPVTGRVYRDEVVTYVAGVNGVVVRMDLSGAVGSDNVDPYRTMSDSLQIT
jgi:hypothetical protein